MEKYITEYIDNMFSSFEKNLKTDEIKEELKTNLQEKIHDLTEAGATFNSAFDKGVSSLGTIEDIKRTFDLKEKQTGLKQYLLEIVLLLSFSTVYISLSWIFQIWDPLWIIYLAMFLILATKHGGPGASLLFALLAYLMVGILYAYWIEGLSIFGLSFSILAYRDEAIAGLWVFLITCYLVLSYIFGIWHPLWLLVFIGFVITVLVTEKSIVGATWLLCIGLYLFFGFVFNLWAIMWVLFILSATVTVIVEAKKAEQGKTVWINL